MGYTSAALLYKSISCQLHLHKITVPVMFLIAKDDPITKFNVVPMDDLKRNPNFMVGVTDKGGHCEFFQTKRHSLLNGSTYRRKVGDVTLTYFDSIEKYL